MRDAQQMPLSHDAVYDYLDARVRKDVRDPVLDSMEEYADQRSIPLIGRAAGRYLELAARSIGARRVFEMGSGLGYSSYWFASAVGATGEVVCADEDRALHLLARRYLEGSPQWAPLRHVTGEVIASLDQTEDAFDIIFCDELKDRYPACWRAAAERIRIGGLYVADNALWHGGVISGQDVSAQTAGYTEAVIEHGRLIAEDRRFISSLVPIRDGLLVALRVS